jgi:hypothetical protein
MEFGVKLKCLLCGVELTKENLSHISRLHCKYCRPAPKKPQIGRYRGKSQFYKERGYAGA